MGGYDSGRNPPRRFLRHNGHSALNQRMNLDTIATFKQVPSFQSNHFKTNRPVIENCCVCMPQRKLMESSDMKDLGVRNLLDCRKELSSKAGWLSSLFPLEVYTVQKPLFKTFPDVSLQVLSSPRVQKAIEDTAQQMVENSDEPVAKVSNFLESQSCLIMKRMKASLSAVFIKIAAWLITKFLRNILGGIHVSSSQMKMLKRFSEENVPLIYLPLHRSHLDYILVTLTLWYFDIRAPYVAAGENLDIPFFNLLLRGLGGFFIRRRLDKKAGQKDILYRAILCQYMMEILKNNEAIEFFIEGGRTRSGRAVIPKGGLLSIIVEAFNKGEIPDAYIVPASFGYERIIDGDFTREQMGLTKIDESFFGAMTAILKVLFGYYGSIRVDFAVPFSLREFLDNAKDNPNISTGYLPDMVDYSVLDQSASSSALRSQTSYPSHMTCQLYQDGEMAMANCRLLVKALADHTVYISDRCSTPMSTHLVAFLLLTKHRQGVKLDKLSQDLQWIAKELHSFHVDVGFCGKSRDVVLYAQRLLGDKLVTRINRTKDGSVCDLCPNLSIPSVFELSYYANFVSTHFALESIIACALIHESNLSLFQLMTSTTLPETKINRGKVLEIAGQFCELLHTEFIFVPPCTSLENALSDLFDAFVSKEILEEDKTEDYGLNDNERRLVNHLAQSLEMDDEDEDDGWADCDDYQLLKINTDHADVRERLLFLVSVLGPVIESHWIVASFAVDRLSCEMTGKEFFNQLASYAHSRVKNDLSLFAESCAVFNLKSAVKSFQDVECLYSYSSAGLELVGMSEQLNARERLDGWATIIQTTLS